MNNYEEWVRKTKKEIFQALAEAEDAGWHHLPYDGGSIEARTYQRLHTWLSEIIVRVERLDGRR